MKKYAKGRIMSMGEMDSETKERAEKVAQELMEEAQQPPQPKAEEVKKDEPGD